MALTINDVIKVSSDMIIAVRDRLPEGFLSSYPILQDPGKIFRILEPGTFKMAFDQHVAFFEGVLNCKISVTGVDAFVSPEPDHAKRRIYVKIGGDETHGVLVHEFIHWLSHPDFYPAFYKTAGTAPGIVEGTTEYFTRKYAPQINRQFYQREYVAMSNIANLEREMYAAVFKGDKQAMKTIQAAYKLP